MTTRTARKSFEFTGRHMLAVMLAFFGVIIAVNFTMAYLATSSWSGLVVENTYVASQEFNGKSATIRAILASGIKGDTTVTPGKVSYRLTLPGDVPVIADRVTLHFKRPVGDRQDFVLDMVPAGGGQYVAEHAVAPGHWIVEAIAVKDGRTVMHDANRIAVMGEVK